MKGEFYKMDFRAWNVGTVDLTLEQEAAYLRLCHAMYDVGGAVPNSTRMLMGLFRCGNAKALALLAALIKAGKIAATSDGRLINHRVSEELASREQVSAARRIAGERGGSASRVNAEWVPSDPRVIPECSPTDPRLTASKALKNNETTEAIAPTLRSRGEERREDKKEDPQDPNGSSAPKGADVASATRIPNDFEHWPAAREAVLAAGYVPDEVEDVLGEFVDYWRPLPKGKAATKTDWIATLRNRLRDLKKRQPRPRAGPPSGGRSNPYHDVARDALEQAHGTGSDAAGFRPRLISGSRH
jgi:uncharacterized protein YdaU (DUF1376 family)